MDHPGTDSRAGMSIVLVTVIAASCCGAEWQVKLVSVKPTVSVNRNRQAVPPRLYPDRDAELGPACPVRGRRMGNSG